MMQNYNWEQLASISANSEMGALNAARCAADPLAVACDATPWTAKGYYDNYIDRNLGITNTALRNAAFYVEGKFSGNGFGFIPSFSGNIGVRVVRQILSGDGNLIVEANNSFYLDQASAMAALANGGQPTQQGDIYQVAPSSQTRSKELSFTRALPSFNIKFDISPKLILRVAASEGISPPNLGDIRAGGHVAAATDSRTGVAPGTTTPLTVNFLKNMVSQSGANMKPVMIGSGDLSLEWYPKDGVFAYLDLFGKELKDQDLYTYYYQVQSTPLLKGAAKTPVTVDLPWFYQQNTSIHKPAEIKGLEIGGRKFLDNGIFKGFGVSGSLTYVESRNPSQLANSVV
ncbi:MAG: TonB-dependent receptor, partial [Asticcacaulis sp.]|nr:TonB-dependent receptor [Asticcacaulis sp.]